MKKYVVDVEVKTGKAQKSVKDLNKEIGKTNKEVKDTKGNLSGVSSIADKATGGMITSFKAVAGSLSGVTKGFKSMRLAIISTGIGVLVVLIGSLVAAFSSSEAGQNKFIRLCKQMGVVIDNLIDILADLGEGLIEAFEKPIPAMKSFGDSITENVKNRLEATVDMVNFMGDAFKKVFSGDFTGALDDAKMAGNAYVDSLTGVRNTIDKTKQATIEFIQEQQREIEIAGVIADLRAAADKIERKLIVDRAKANRDIAELRDKAAQKDKFTLEERKQALLDANEINERITNAEIKAAKIRRDAILEENKISKSNKEALDKAAEARAKVIQLETAKLNLQKRLNTELATINTQAANEAAAAAKKAEDDLIKKEKLEQDALKKQFKREDEQYKLLQELQSTAEEQEINKLVEQYDKKFELAQGNAALEKELTIKQNEDLLKINIKFRQKDLENDARIMSAKHQLQNAFVNASAQALGLVAQIAGEGTKVAKAAGIADIIIKTGVGFAQGLEIAQKSAAGTGPAAAYAFPIFYATQVAAVLSAVSQAKNILGKVKEGPSPSSIPLSGGGFTGGGATSTGISSQAPDFNVVGQSGFNQVATALGENNDSPIKAYVVSGDVTTAQALDNNIIDTATL